MNILKDGAPEHRAASNIPVNSDLAVILDIIEKAAERLEAKFTGRRTKSKTQGGRGKSFVFKTHEEMPEGAFVQEFKPMFKNAAREFAVDGSIPENVREEFCARMADLVSTLKKKSSDRSFAENLDTCLANAKTRMANQRKWGVRE